MTGWIRYRICDRSGGGWNNDRWLYEPWLCEDCPDGVREHVVQTCESWAIYAESYSFEAEVNATPPIEVIAKEISRRENKIKAIRESIASLEASI